ncbi:COX15/CtaA family protein [Leptospira neocaledonica]|uniref:Cytochrome oxidase assembly protein n=1 Tax=Leptospira neocaledonica TaxID=2023192 RepID=A0A2N0A1V1_9LEPT|nr:COX15/CtaA family protein [Leptospira neocaledonica]PJZ78304.1 cytochrome oxidase assembly protein [Leptospira neocaledonica]
MIASTYSHFRKFSLFLVLYSVLIFLNLLYGPLVRATDSGLACPDWPFCFGKIFPDFDFNIFMEVGHRYYSGFLGMVLIAGTIWAAIVPELRKPFLGYFILGILLIASQVTLGGLTVLLSLDPATVNLHLLNAILFLLCIVTATFKARVLSKSINSNEFLTKQSLFQKDQIPLLIGVLLIFFQIILGGRVSSNYAGLACLEFPTCNGEWVPSVPEPKIQIQVQHRLGAYLVTFYVLLINLYGIFKGFSAETKKYVRTAIILLILQIGLGIVNVYAKLPKLVTAAHTGVAILLFLSVYAVWVQRASELSKSRVS